MGLGDDALGDVPLGQPPTTSDDPIVQARPKALFFDVKTRTYPLGDDGRYVATDVATAAAQTALFHERGTIPSSPLTGNALRGVDTFGPRALAEADNAVRDALDGAVRRGLVSDIDTQIAPVASGGLKVQVSLHNRVRGEDADFGDEDV